MASTGRTALDSGCSQPLRYRSARDVVDQGRACKRAAGRGFSAVWSAGSDADGSRHAVVEHESDHRMDMADGVADEARHSTLFQRIRTSADTRQGGTLSWGPASCRATARMAGGAGAAAMAGRISLRIQSCATPRSAGDENAGSGVEEKRTEIPAAASRVGL